MYIVVPFRIVGATTVLRNIGLLRRYEKEAIKGCIDAVTRRIKQLLSLPSLDDDQIQVNTVDYAGDVPTATRFGEASSGTSFTKKKRKKRLKSRKKRNNRS